MVLWFILVLAFEGLIIGGLARLALPGPDPMGILGTIGLGLAGTFLGGVIAWAFIGHVGGILFSLIGSILLLYLHRRFVQHRTLTGPASRRPR